MKKAKIIGTIVGVIFSVAAIAGITYAWFTWQSSNITYLEIQVVLQLIMV